MKSLLESQFEEFKKWEQNILQILIKHGCQLKEYTDDKINIIYKGMHFSIQLSERFYLIVIDTNCYIGEYDANRAYWGMAVSIVNETAPILVYPTTYDKKMALWMGFSEREINLQEKLMYLLDEFINVHLNVKAEYEKFKYLPKRYWLNKHGEMEEIKRDPIEKLPQFIEASRKVDAALSLLFNESDRRLGFCHRYWREKQSFLSSFFNINWKTPAEMNPNIDFD